MKILLDNILAILFDYLCKFIFFDKKMFQEGSDILISSEIQQTNSDTIVVLRLLHTADNFFFFSFLKIVQQNISIRENYFSLLRNAQTSSYIYI